MKKNILIIGAGIAGMAACTRLKELGFNPTILEARNRIGGRIWIDESLGVPVGLGAEWIHGDASNPITELANKTGALKHVVDFKNFTRFDRHGRSIPAEAFEKFTDKLDALLKQAQQYAFTLDHDISLAEALSHFLNPADLTEQEQDLFAFRLAYFQGYIGADYELLSARFWDQEEKLPGDNAFLSSSYKPIIEYLGKQCQIQLNTVVKEIQIQQDAVAVVTDKEIFYADAVIVTVPLGSLKANSIRFKPALPLEKQQALERLGMGLLNITALRFPEVFWGKEQSAITVNPVDQKTVATFISLEPMLNIPILIGYSGGSRGLAIEKMSDAELLEKIMRNFKKVYGSDVPEPDVFRHSRWSEDPFSFGAYSYLPTGATPKDYATLAKPIANKIFFAGEACSEKYSATTHGAYLTGLREAENIHKIFS